MCDRALRDTARSAGLAAIGICLTMAPPRICAAPADALLKAGKAWSDSTAYHLLTFECDATSRRPKLELNLTE